MALFVIFTLIFGFEAKYTGTLETKCSTAIDGAGCEIGITKCATYSFPGLYNDADGKQVFDKVYEEV